jgi:RNA polymerase sigma-70 factor (ECF subfamily)
MEPTGKSGVLWIGRSEHPSNETDGIVRTPQEVEPVADIDRQSLEGQLEVLHAASFGWALTCCRFDRDEAQEVLQASYLKAIDGRARFDGKAALRTWFFGVVKTTAREHRRYRVVRSAALSSWFRGLPEPAPVPTPEHLTSAARNQAELNRLLERLSQRQRDLLHLVFYQELSIEEAADVLGVAVGTARTHYERGKARLKKLLSGVGEAKWTSQTALTNR